MSHPYNVVTNKVKEDAKEKKSEFPNLPNHPFIFMNLKKKKKIPPWPLWEKKMFLKLAHSK